MKFLRVIPPQNISIVNAAICRVSVTIKFRPDKVNPMKRIYLLLLGAFVVASVLAQQEIQGQLDEAILLNVGNTAVISAFRITLISVKDDGCGTVRECYWSQYRDATFQVWQGQLELGEITLSLASREDSRRFLETEDGFIVLKNVRGYEIETSTAELYVTKTLERYANE
jgi:hypothetical protein